MRTAELSPKEREPQRQDVLDVAVTRSLAPAGC